MDLALPPLPSSPRGVRRALIELDRLAGLVRRHRLLFRSRLAARRVGAGLRLDVHPSVVLGRHVVIETWHDTRNVVVIGAGARLGDNSWISMRGGRLVIGAGTDVRRGVTINCTGSLSLGDKAVLSTGTHIHCANRVEIGDWTIIGEYSTIIDSNHVRTAVDEPIHHAVETGEVVIGRNVWIGAKATVAADVHIGDEAVVAGSSVVVSDVETGWLVAGIPARPLRPAGGPGGRERPEGSAGEDG